MGENGRVLRGNWGLVWTSTSHLSAVRYIVVWLNILRTDRFVGEVVRLTMIMLIMHAAADNPVKKTFT